MFSYDVTHLYKHSKLTLQQMSLGELVKVCYLPCVIYNFIKYIVPCINLLLCFSEIVLISSRVKYSSSDDITFSYFTIDDMTCSDIIVTLSTSNLIVEIYGFDVT